MISGGEHAEVLRRTWAYFERTGIVLTEAEKQAIETADFGIGDIAATGLEVLVYVNTDRYCAKELVLFPLQTCPEHRHPDVADRPGKMETFRCRWGEVCLYIDGAPTPNPRCRPPQAREAAYTVWHEIVLSPGDQYTIASNTLHWFQAGAAGAAVSEFFSTSSDEAGLFTDPDIQRLPQFQ